MARRLCPECQQAMSEETKFDFTVDICLDHGMWLDSGELEEIVRATRRKSHRVWRKQVGRLMKANEQLHSYYGIGGVAALLYDWWHESREAKAAQARARVKAVAARKKLAKRLTRRPSET
ncbi:MAG: zf-TFIIB domain-containing protein [Planctomycetota bacterium]